MSGRTGVFVLRELNHIKPFLAGFAVIGTIFFKAGRANWNDPKARKESDYAFQLDNWRDAKKMQAKFDHGLGHGHGAHDDHTGLDGDTHLERTVSYVDKE